MLQEKSEIDHVYQEIEDKVYSYFKGPNDHSDLKVKIKFVNELEDKRNDITKIKCNAMMQLISLDMNKEDFIDLIYTCYKQNKFTPLWSLSIHFLGISVGIFNIFSYYGIFSLHLGNKYKYPHYTLKDIIEWFQKCLKETEWISPEDSYESVNKIREELNNKIKTN